MPRVREIQKNYSSGNTFVYMVRGVPLLNEPPVYDRPVLAVKCRFRLGARHLRRVYPEHDKSDVQRASGDNMHCYCCMYI